MKTLERISVDPGICLGQPRIRNTRITVSIILKLLAGGKSETDIIKMYPELEKDDIHESLKYAAWLSEERYFDAPLRRVI